jgi:hypothetical protein
MIIAIASRRYTDDLTLFTSICVSVPKLLWATLQRVPQNYHVVKALCLVCYWPFPISSSSADPTFMLCGTMKHLALQCGLQRPGFVTDFSKTRVAMTPDDLEDRVRTWAMCNIVAQSVSTACGQPSPSLNDWTLEQAAFSSSVHWALHPDILVRLQIEQIVNQATKSLYGNIFEPDGLCSRHSRANLIGLLDSRLIELGAAHDMTGLMKMHLLGARMHVQLCHLFDEDEVGDNLIPLLSLYDLCQQVIDFADSLDNVCGFYSFCGNPLIQMLLSTSFALLLLLSSALTDYVNVENGQRLYNRAVIAIRKISSTNNDLPARLAEVLAQMWRRPSGQPGQKNIRLLVRCRMSMSVMYSHLWIWRDLIQERERLEPSHFKPTNPEFLQNAAAAKAAVVLTNLRPGEVPSQLDERDRRGDQTNSQFDPLELMLDGLDTS